MITLYRILILLTLCLMIASCVTTEALLRERIKKYYADQNPRTMWELSSDRFRNGITEEEYVEYFNEHNYLKKEFEDISFSVEEIITEKGRARVRIRIQGKAIAGNTKIDEVLYDHWVFEHDTWYMNEPGRTD
jgi:hypothetical protein